MAGFIGRKTELSRLENIWNSELNKSCVVYGRRRVGKSELLIQFCMNKRALYVECIQESLANNMRNIAKSLSLLDGKERKGYEFIVDALEDVFHSCATEKTVIVMDEIPYLIQQAPHVASALQHFVDRINRETDSMIIICGSFMSVILKETTDYNKPLYGRFSHYFRIEPLTLAECVEFHPKMSKIDQTKLYLTVGGIPKYHLDSNVESYKEYVIKHFFSRFEADLIDEAKFLISGEFVPAERYLSILTAISDGATSAKTISEKSKIERMTCSNCLSNLCDVGIVQKVPAMFDAPIRPVYRIANNLTDFVQSICSDSRNLALRNASEIFDMLMPKINTLLGQRFEDICLEYTTYRWKCMHIGKWWGVDKEKETHEIDIAAVIMESDARFALFGECKFRNKPLEISVYNKLVSDSELVKTDLPKKFVLFSSSGFTEDLKDIEEEGAVTLIDLDDLLKPYRNPSESL